MFSSCLSKVGLDEEIKLSSCKIINKIKHVHRLTVQTRVMTSAFDGHRMRTCLVASFVKSQYIELKIMRQEKSVSFRLLHFSWGPFDWHEKKYIMYENFLIIIYKDLVSYYVHLRCKIHLQKKFTFYLYLNIKYRFWRFFMF